MNEIQKALEIAAEALDIAADWNLYDVQVFPPEGWGLETCGEDAGEGWCSTRALAKKIREIAAREAVITERRLADFYATQPMEEERDG